VAGLVGRGEAACRQLGYRARKHVGEHQRRFDASRRQGTELAARFFAAAGAGDMDGLVSMLAADAVVTGDSGGVRPSWPRPITGRDRVARLMIGVGLQMQEAAATVRLTGINGQPGAIFVDADGALISVMALEIADGQVVGVRAVISRDKLRHLGPLADIPALREQVRGADPRRAGPTQR
jgi:RNA polymerase sigma-70 factor (ECF subfamily)